jgi:site-specific recombinase XerD
VTFSAVRAMYTHWKKSGYISANAALAVDGQKRDQVTMDVFRSFTEADLQVVGDTFADLPDGPAKRRLRALFRLIENAGLRRAEVAQARWSHVQTDRALERGSWSPECWRSWAKACANARSP